MDIETGQRVGKYTVVCALPHFGKHNTYFRVIDDQGRKRYMCLQPEPFSSCALQENVQHVCLLSLLDHGIVDVKGVKMFYRVTDFVSGETLAQRLKREGRLSVHKSKQIVRQLLSLVNWLHCQPGDLSLGALSPSEIVLHLRDDGLSLLRTPSASRKAYQAPESVAGQPDPEKDDVYLIGKLFYLMLFGGNPKSITSVCGNGFAASENPRGTCLYPLPITKDCIFELNDEVIRILERALSHDLKERYDSVADMLKDLDLSDQDHVAQMSVPVNSDNNSGPMAVGKIGSAQGFASIAGMSELKSFLTASVINLLRHTDRAKRYRIHIPNGMLLYGPPGCGKSFFAEKFAEEVGYNSMHIKASDLASVYVHGTQGKIKELFEQARNEAPTVICFDEFDAMSPSRNGALSPHQYGEVNELLSQLNNCGKDGIFVIASTNKPELIDPAFLRSGRIDKVVYVPEPDSEARRELFSLHLQGRPCGDDIDTLRLADLTQGYVCSDIEAIVNEAAISAAEQDAPISQRDIEEVIERSAPSVSKRTLQYYELMKRRLDLEYGK